MAYTRKFMEGLGSQFLYRGVAAGLAFIKLLVLARLLTPTQFGVFSLVLIALGVTEAATETGINLTILQSKKPITYFLNTAWVISIARGVMIALIMLAIGGFMNYYYQDPSVLPLVFFAASIPLIRGLINPSVVMMQRELKFLNDGLFRISLTLVEVTAAISFAWLTRSVYALVGAMVAAAIWEVILSFVIFKNRPRFEYVASRARVIFGNTKWLSITAVLNYLQENMDNLLIGKFLGTANLGYYDLGYRLSHKTHELARASHFSSLPIYIRVKTEPTRLLRAFTKTFASTIGLLFLAGLPLFFFPQLTVIFFGIKWAAIVSSIPVLTGAALLLSATTLCYTLFLSREEYSRVTAHLLLSTVLMAGLIWWLSPWGLLGASWAILLSRLISSPLLLWGVWKHYRYAQG